MHILQFFAALIVALLIGYWLFLLYDLKKYHQQLARISEIETNQEIHLQTRVPALKAIALLNNQILRKNKQQHYQMLQENQQLEQAIQNISHDLRTPLTVASGYTQLLQADTTLDNQQLQLLEKVSSNLEKVENHLEQLLTYQRLKDNQLALTLEEFDLSRLLEEELLQLYPSFEENHLSLTVAIQPNIMIISDKKSWQRIFQNVLGNLLEHGNETGTIRLKQQGDRIVFQQENQLRTPIQHPEKLTHRFYTEDLSRHKQQAGLGLYIIAALTHALAGEIQLDTTEETFRLTLSWQQSAKSH